MIEMHTPLWEVLLRLFAAVGLAMIIGIDREKNNKPAGLRTHMLVSLGSAAFVIGALELAAGPIAEAVGSDAKPDPTRVIEGIIHAIGFLGAGAIIQARGNVQGLTTGVSVWISGAIGVACGGGFYVLAVIVAVMAFIILAALLAIEARLFPETGKEVKESPRNS
jgi:putative Mg2+ transporter-C (MgtC) family protein